MAEKELKAGDVCIDEGIPCLIIEESIGTDLIKVWIGDGKGGRRVSFCKSLHKPSNKIKVLFNIDGDDLRQLILEKYPK